jgi:hypothetical protein
MPTTFVFTRTQTVEVTMADPGETEDETGEVCRWATFKDQEDAAKEWAEQTFLDEDYCEPWMDADPGKWELKEIKGGDWRGQAAH